MKRPLARRLAAPQFHDRDATSAAEVLHWICWTVLAISTAPAVLTLLGDRQTRAPLAIYACIFAVTVCTLWLVRAGRVRTAAIFFTLSLWAVLVTATALLGGTRSPRFCTFFAVVLSQDSCWEVGRDRIRRPQRRGRGRDHMGRRLAGRCQRLPCRSARSGS